MEWGSRSVLPRPSWSSSSPQTTGEAAALARPGAWQVVFKVKEVPAHFQRVKSGNAAAIVDSPQVIAAGPSLLRASGVCAGSGSPVAG
jgi:hypothetical protein